MVTTLWILLDILLFAFSAVVLVVLIAMIKDNDRMSKENQKRWDSLREQYNEPSEVDPK